MTPEQFTYWLQGMLESRAEGTALGEKEVTMIREHLKTVFHKVTPTFPNTQPHFPGPQPAPGTWELGKVIC